MIEGKNALKDYKRNDTPNLIKRCSTCDPLRNDRLLALTEKMIWVLDNPENEEWFNEQIELWYKTAKQIVSEN